MPLSPELVEILRCPRSGEALVYLPAGDDGPAVLYCRQARLKYRIEDDIPVLLPEEAEEVDDLEAARLDARAG